MTTSRHGACAAPVLVLSLLGVLAAAATPASPVRESRARAPSGGHALSHTGARQALPAMARIIWLEAAGDARQQPDQTPVFAEIPASDPRLVDLNRWIDTEAGRFARRLVFRAWQRFQSDPVFRDPVLPIVIRKGGNNAAYAMAISRPGGAEAHPTLAYLILDPSPAYLGDTIVHETGHLLQSLAMRGRRNPAPWSAFPHTTFAVSDPITALAEGFGIHFETLWGHFGSDEAKRAYYQRTSPSFEAGKGRKAEYFSPVDDLMNFAQVWSRYQSVRDGLAAFEGHLYQGSYARTQMDPARDRARLKSPNAMLASEGVAASVIFWIVTGLAAEGGALPGRGLDQPGLVAAEMTLLEAFAALADTESAPFRPDLLDFVEALGRGDARAGDVARARLVDLTRGVTARPALRARWQTLYNKAIMLDLPEARALITQMDAERGAIVEQARRDPSSLRAGVGPVIPVRLSAATFELKALGERLPVEFDLNAMSAPELALLSRLDENARARIERERERAPFASAADFAARTGLTLEALGLAEVDLTTRRNFRN